MKFSYEQRLEVALAYLNGNGSYKKIARQFHMDPSDVQKWVALYRNHGVDGLTKKTGKYTGDFKVSVIEYMHKNKISVRETAAHFKIPSFRSVLMWERIYYEQGAEGLYKERRGKARKMNPKLHSTQLKTVKENELLLEVQKLRMENEYLKKYNALIQEKSKMRQK
ncbi:transposase [Enterococcus faecium]|nr:transposase [Enterococcus faecium]EME7116546.1 transposase [Enterococcus faecium]